MALRTPVIPENITVHLGRPEESAPNVTVPFPDYIKNVASGEIYPTWSESALRANIYAQISFALNRVFVEYYRSRGYDFDITSSTSIDQSFSQGRNIFENISLIVDDIFASYLKRPEAIEPLLAEFCNGTTTTCDGLSQWGSENLAQQGYGPFDILTYYYGDNLTLVTDVPVADIPESYPGEPLRRGSEGTDVYIIQFALNNISNSYPLIPKINPINYVFDENTENSVKTFQGIFGLTQDGIVGRRTWYKIIYLYTGLRKLSELNSLGIDLDEGTILSSGTQEIKFLQYMLSVIAQLYNEIPEVKINGIYSDETKNAVKAFQMYFGLPENDDLTADVFDNIYSVYITSANYLDTKGYTFEGFKSLSGAMAVTEIQKMLNNVSKIRKDIEYAPPTGYIGTATKNNIYRIKKMYGISESGLLGRETVRKIAAESSVFVNCSNPSRTQYPGYILRQGMTDGDLKSLGRTITTPIKNAQIMLREISYVYPEVIKVVPTSAFGSLTKSAVDSFQKLIKVPVTGFINFPLWQKIAQYYEYALQKRFPPFKTSPYKYDMLPFIASSANDETAMVTVMLNALKKIISEVVIQEPTYIINETFCKNIKLLQKILHLPETGEVSRETWDGITKIYEALINEEI